MNTAESRILSILRPGDLIRFVLRSSDEGRIDVSVEGAPAEGGDGLLAERLGLVLGELRGLGYLFGACQQPKRRAKVVTRPSRSRPDKDRWVEIRPLAKELSSLCPGSVGFNAKQTAESTVVRLPDLPNSVVGKVVDSLVSLLPGIPQVAALEIDFTKFTLEGRFTKPLEEGLRLYSMARQTTIPGFDQPSVPETFLALWLLHRSGWRVAARVLMTGHDPIPVAALEMIGRDLFRCECEVLTTASEGARDGVLDLADCYPCGWPFSAILPVPDSSVRLAAGCLHNVVLPELPKTGMTIGKVEGAEVRLPLPARDRHTYIVGATGTGKSTLLARMIREDMRRGEGVILLDPHGDLFDQVLEAVPAGRRKHLTIINPFDDAPPPGINFLDVGSSPRPAWRIRFMIGELLRFFENVWDMRSVGGPMFEMYFRNALLLLADQGVRERSCHTLLNFTSLLSDKEFRNHQLEVCRNEDVKNFWKNVAEKAGGESSLVNIVPYIVSKMELLTQSSFIREMIGRPQDTLCIREKMDRQQIVLCNLSKGALGVTESRLLGTMLLAQIFAAGLERGLQPSKQRKPVNIYVDEFQNFVSDNMASMLSEARKFGLRLVLANQTLGQLKANTGQQDLLETVLGNVGNMILFRLGVPDAEQLKLFIEPFTRQEMQELPNYHALARLMTPEGPIKPFIMQTLPA